MANRGDNSSDSELELMNLEDRQAAQSQIIAMSKVINHVGVILKDLMMETSEKVESFVKQIRASNCTRAQKRKLSTRMQSMLGEAATGCTRLKKSVEERAPSVQGRVRYEPGNRRGIYPTAASSAAGSPTSWMQEVDEAVTDTAIADLARAIGFESIHRQSTLRRRLCG